MARSEVTTRPAVAGNASQAARRQRIVDAALELLQDRPYEQIQMRDVAEPFHEYSGAFSTALSDALHDVDPSDVVVISTMSSALIGTLLRSWWLGRISMRSVYDQLDRSVALMFHGVG